MPLDPSDLFQYGQEWSGRLIDLLRQLGASSVPAGGTTGQVLEKSSNADYDTEWASGGGSQPLVVDISQTDLEGYVLSDPIDTSAHTRVVLDVTTTAHGAPQDDELAITVLTRPAGGGWQMAHHLTFNQFNGQGSGWGSYHFPCEDIPSNVPTQSRIRGRLCAFGLMDESVVVMQSYSYANAVRAQFQTDLGDPDQDLLWRCAHYGEVGNLLTIAYIDPAANDIPFSFDSPDFAFALNLATDGGGAILTHANDLSDTAFAGNAGPTMSLGYLVTAADVTDGSALLEAMSPQPLSGGDGMGAVVSFEGTATFYA